MGIILGCSFICVAGCALATSGAGQLQSAIIDSSEFDPAVRQDRHTAVKGAIKSPGDKAAAPEPGYSIDAVNLPLQVMLYSLAEQAGLEITLDASLTQPVTLRVVDKTLKQILKLLAEQTGIRWQIIQDKLSIASIEPFLYSYPVDYLNMSRVANSRVGLATQVGSINLSADAGSASSGFSNSSQSVIENQSNHQFWESLAADLAGILALAAGQSGALMINRDTGVVSVRGSAQQHREVKAYLQKVQEVARRQVLIEATVVEVALSDEYQAGIDWRALADGSGGINAAQVFHGQALVTEAINALPAPSSLLAAIHQSNTLGQISATLQLLQGFGNVRILSRPQILALNNQSAILKVVDNRVYFTNILGYRYIDWCSPENIIETNRLREYFDFMTDGRFPTITISASLILALGVSIKASSVAQTVQEV